MRLNRNQRIELIRKGTIVFRRPHVVTKQTLSSKINKDKSMNHHTPVGFFKTINSEKELNETREDDFNHILQGRPRKVSFSTSTSNYEDEDADPHNTDKRTTANLDLYQNEVLPFSEDEDLFFVGGSLIRASNLFPPPASATDSRNMINNERIKRSRLPLKRNSALDEIAKGHAEAMARQEKLCNLVEKSMNNIPTILGCNVGRGSTINDIHKSMLSHPESGLNNMIDQRFVYMGAGTAKSLNGKTTYLCQIFGD